MKGNLSFLVLAFVTHGLAAFLGAEFGASRRSRGFEREFRALVEQRNELLHALRVSQSQELFWLRQLCDCDPGLFWCDQESQRYEVRRCGPNGELLITVAVEVP